MKKSLLPIVIVSFFIPIFANAQCAPLANPLGRLLCQAGDLINVAIGFASSLALLVFIWGLVKFLAKAGDEKAKEEGKQVMIWGVVALFVLFSVFGLIWFMRDALGVDADTKLPPPRVDFSR